MTEREKVKVARELAREAVDSYNTGAISKFALNELVRAVMAYEIQVSLEEKLDRNETVYRTHVGPKKHKLLGDLLTR